MKNVFSATFQGDKALLNNLELQLDAAPHAHCRYIGIRSEDIILQPEKTPMNGRIFSPGMLPVSAIADSITKYQSGPEQRILSPSFRKNGIRNATDPEQSGTSRHPTLCNSCVLA